MVAAFAVGHGEAMHVLCGIDESAPARAAAHVAGTLSRRLDADLTLVHVAPDGAAGAGARFGDIADDVAIDTGARVDLRIEAGRPAHRLLELGEELGCSLLVIGQTRRGRIADALLGDVHHRVLRSSSIPVALVPPGASFLDPGRLVLACRRSASPQRSARFAGRLAAALAVPITITQVLPMADRRRPTSWEIYDAARRDCHAAAEAAGDVIDIDCLELVGDPARRLTEACDALDACLLVVGARRHDRWRALARPSLASLVARRSTHPVIVVPERGAVEAADVAASSFDAGAVSGR